LSGNKPVAIATGLFMFFILQRPITSLNFRIISLLLITNKMPMETIYAAVQELQLGLFTVIISCSLLFFVGYKLGAAKSKKFIKKINKMEKEILDLNAELLYSSKESGSLMKAGSPS